jgi:hypothetical protein
MNLDEQKKKRIRFNWRDTVALALVGAASISVFVWSYFSSSSIQGASFLQIKYLNAKVAENVKVVDDNGSKMEFALSFRREISQADKDASISSYVNVSGYGEEVNLTVKELQALSDFSSYQKKYLIVTSDSSDTFKGFSYLYGPQVDVKVSNGGFQVIKEYSPNHICSNQGFTDRGNYPITCLPNSMEFTLISASSEPGPDV